MKLRLYIFVFCLLQASLLSYGQTTKYPLITASFQDARIEDFVKVLEQQSGYKFYYDPAIFDTIAVTFTIKTTPLDEVLKTAFRYTDFYASIDADNHVFLTKGAYIVTQLSSAGRVSKKDSLRRAYLTSALVKDKPVSTAFANEKLYTIGIKTRNVNSGLAAITVYSVNSRDKEPLAGSVIGLDGKEAVAETDSNGVYKLKMTKGRHVLTIKSFAKKLAIRHLMVYEDGTVPVELEDEIRVLEDVYVTTQKNTSVNRAQLGVEKLNIKSIKNVPTVFGEADILRVILTLPGVKSVGEASTGFNVRGGAADQNLILFNDATIYNPSHFFGFFSAFNPEVIKDVELYKSSIPAKYGGRLSSVLDITGREGNKQKFNGSAGIGLVTSRLNIEGPIKKDKSSFILGGRTTYADWLLKLLPESYKN